MRSPRACATSSSSRATTPFPPATRPHSWSTSTSPSSAQRKTRFAEYEAQVAREYAWVPREIYVRERTKILQSFLDREWIYTTDAFRARYEAAARRNLAWSIAQLPVTR